MTDLPTRLREAAEYAETDTSKAMVDYPEALMEAAAEIERLTALLDEATEALEVCNRNTQGLSRDNFAFHCRIAATVSRATLSRIKEPSNDQ